MWLVVFNDAGTVRIGIGRMSTEVSGGTVPLIAPLEDSGVMSSTLISTSANTVGVIYTGQKKYPEALDALKSAEAIDPEQPDVHYRLGRLYQAMGDAATAKAEFERVKALHEKADEDVARKMSGQAPGPKM